jgi:hypothetical protein
LVPSRYWFGSSPVCFAQEILRVLVSFPRLNVSVPLCAADHLLLHEKALKEDIVAVAKAGRCDKMSL